MDDLQRTNPCKLLLMKSKFAEDAKELETGIKHLLRLRKVRGQEWFKLTREQVEGVISLIDGNKSTTVISKIEPQLLVK